MLISMKSENRTQLIDAIAINIAIMVVRWRSQTSCRHYEKYQAGSRAKKVRTAEFKQHVNTMDLNIVSIVSSLSRLQQIKPVDGKHDINAVSNMNVKLNPNFFDKQMEKLPSSSSSSSTSNALLGLQNRVFSNKTHNNGHSNGTYNQTTTSTSTLSYNKPLPFHSHKELALAERSIQKLVEDSNFFPPQAANEDWFHRSNICSNNGTTSNATKVTTLYESELQVGRLLGRGGFCQVRLATLKKNGGKATSDEYALKYLQPSSKSKSSFARGAADLAIEARFLSLLSHENIISLHYVSEGTLAETYNCLDVESLKKESDCFCDNEGQQQLHMPALRSYGYFIVLDYLRDTLLQRIQNLYIPSMMSHGLPHPKAHHDKHNCHYGQQPGHHGNEKSTKQDNLQQLHWWNKKLWARNGSSNDEEHVSSKKIAFVQESLKKRLKILKQIALALEYLHSNGIIYRDGKGGLLLLIWDPVLFRLTVGLYKYQSNQTISVSTSNPMICARMTKTLTASPNVRILFLTLHGP
jgi:hypothetical protein